MIGKDGPAIEAATKAAFAVLKLPEFRLSARARSLLKVVDVCCLGLHKPAGFIDHVTLTLQTGTMEFNIYALVTFGVHGPLSAELFIYMGKEFRKKIACSFRPDGTPDPWANR